MTADPPEFREYIAVRMDPLRRTAYVLCGDWHTADDLVSVAIVKLYRNWSRISAMTSPDSYVRRILINAWFDERRRPWRRETTAPVLPDVARAAGDGAVVDRITILEHLAKLPKRRRAVIVLRYFCDLSVEETAGILACSPGTVKSQTARALETLRSSMVNVAEHVRGE